MNIDVMFNFNGFCFQIMFLSYLVCRKLARRQRQKDKAKKLRDKEIEKRRRELVKEREKKAEERRAEKEAARAEMDEEEEVMFVV